MSVLTGHWTKVLGGITVASGAVEAVDPGALSSFLQAVVGARGPGLALALLGAATVWRGFMNTRNAQEAAPSEVNPPTAGK